MRHILLVCLVFLSFSLGAQTLSFLFKGTVENSDLGKNEAGVTVSIVQGGSTISSATTASNGKYSLKGDVNYKQPFSVVFSKSGLVSKRVNFNFALLNEEDIPAGSEYQPVADLSMALFSEKPSTDFSFLKTEPVATFDWNGSKAIPELDKVASEKMKARIEKLLLQADQNNAANDAKYQAAIKEADNLYLNLKKYEEARVKYEEALMLKPKEKYPNDRILELDALIMVKKKEDLAAQQADSEYLNLIKAADLLRDQKKYDQAIAKYEEAITKKDEQYPKDQAAALRKLVEDQKKQAEIDAKYLEAVKAADMFFGQKSWEAAKEKYLVANGLKPTEQHPINRLAEIDKKIAEKNAANEKKQKYDEAIAAADQLFTEEKYEEAKVKYTEAKLLMPNELYPPDRIRECDSKILEKAKEKEKADKIAKLLSEGQVLMTGSKWNEAKLKYNEVLVLDPVSEEAKSKLAEIAQKQKELEDQAAIDAKFNKLVLEGDAAAKVLKYQDAKAKYEAALELEKDAAVQTKLDDVLKKIKEEEDKKASEEKFQQLKTEGMKLAAEQQWIDAKTKLTEALAIKTDAAITAKLKEIEEKIKANEALVKLEKDYADLIAAAEAKEAAKDYDGAIAKYKEALVKKPNEQLPKDRIAALELLKGDAAKQKEIDEKYRAFIKAGDDLVKAQKYIEAIQQYNEALGLKPNEQEPVDKAKEAERLSREKTSEADALFEKILSAAEKKIEEKDYVNARVYANRAAENRKNDPRPKELLRKIDDLERQEKEYKARMQEAETFASAKEYQKAIYVFEKAKTIKPDETKPQERIDEMNRLIKESASALEKEQLYKDYMTKGDLSKNAKNWDQALSHYQNALSVKENDQTAKDRIAEVQQIIDDLNNAAKSEQERKNQFDALIAAADLGFSQEDFLGAKANYEKALLLDNSSSYAKKQMDECDKRQRLKDLSIADAEYAAIIKEADENFDIKSYDKARTNYERALSIRPTDIHPKDRLAEIDAILNPVVQKVNKLEDLGVPYDNSIMDGYAALVKADIERKNLKDAALIETVDNIKETENELSEIKKIEQQQTTNEIYQITSKIAISNEAADLNRQLTVDVLTEAEKDMEDERTQSNISKHEDNLKSQETLNVLVERSALDNTIRQNVYQENTQVFTDYATEEAERVRKQGETEADMSITADQKLIAVNEYMSAEAQDNFEERKETERAVIQVVQRSVDIQTEMSSAKSEELLGNKETLVKVDDLVAEKMENDAKLAPGNKESLKVIESTLVEAESVRGDEEYIHSADINAKVEDINISIIENNVQRDLNRQETTHSIEVGRTDIEKAAYADYANENVKYLQAKNAITQEVERNSGIAEMAAEKQSENVTSIELLDKKAQAVYKEVALGDDEERLSSRSNVEIINANNEESSKTSTEKQAKNATKLDDVNKTIEKGATNLGENQTEKHYDAQAKLNNIELKQPEKVKLANSLGQDYPEGVSQESFTQNDENGLMTAIITRRIVVVEGHGDVYVRTQTLHAITYTKNGAPTTEMVWQKETQGPHLQKHY